MLTLLRAFASEQYVFAFKSFIDILSIFLVYMPFLFPEKI
jgi:hypothetical protein